MTFSVYYLSIYNDIIYISFSHKLKLMKHLTGILILSRVVIYHVGCLPYTLTIWVWPHIWFSKWRWTQSQGKQKQRTQVWVTFLLHSKSVLLERNVFYIINSKAQNWELHLSSVGCKMRNIFTKKLIFKAIFETDISSFHSINTGWYN